MNDQLQSIKYGDKWDERLLGLLMEYKEYIPLNNRVRSYSNFFGVPPKGVVIFEEEYSFHKLPNLERAIRTLLKDWRLVDERRFDYGGEELVPKYLSVEVEEGVFESVLEDGIRYFENPNDGKKLIIREAIPDNPEGRKLLGEVWFIMRREDGAYLKRFVQDVGDWMKRNPYLKGKKVRPDGSLLKIPINYSFDDIVLSQEISKEIEENILDFFRNREDYLRNGLPRKRGIILYGEPGVGKTLLGKILCSQIDCTFIWVTPSKMNLPAEVSQLFEMARELSPAIIFMEDLDFYASSRLSLPLKTDQAGLIVSLS